MDLEQKFFAVVRETVAALKQRGKSPQTWTSDDGRKVTGWSVTTWSQGPETEGQPGQGWWRESWANGCTILVEDGKFWEYSFHGQDEKDKKTELTHYIRETPRSYLVGSKGKPFAETTDLLERLPYL